MGYRELSRMEIVEVVRRWQTGASQRGVARATGLARETVRKCLAAAGTLGLSQSGPPPTDEQIAALVRLGCARAGGARAQADVSGCWYTTSTCNSRGCRNYWRGWGAQLIHDVA